MQRQKSILSFFKKPSPENQTSGDRKSLHIPANQQSHNPPRGFATDSDPEVTGTDTPPEKVPRQILPENYIGTEIRNGGSLFSSIMHKFAKPGDRGTASERDKSEGGSPYTQKASEKTIECKVLPKKDTGSQLVDQKNSVKSNGKVDQSFSFCVESDDDTTPPETPGTRRLFPRLKRIQEDGPNSVDKGYERSLFGTSKKMRLLEEPADFKKGNGDGNETASSKFEWLDPSQIRDANRRKRDHPLYDSTTLHIPPDALKKMSASQKQYWSVKSQYMDVVVFFKVGKFYELYEIDAEIGHKELDWKITLSGVGKCKQVGVSESGIDDAVQKLVARGYKVGRIEQLETSTDAKARGATSVISRKLVQVVTPSTATDVSLGPDAVHLLAIKEGNVELDNGSKIYGFAFVDCAALKFWVGSIKDDGSFSGLGALLMQVSPKEVLYESRGLSKDFQRALRKYSITGSSATQLTPLQPISDFADASEIRNLIQTKGYFKGSSDLRNNVVDNVIDQEDVSISALGGLIDHLSRIMLDDVLRNGEISPYQVYRGCLKMDGQTLVNLEIFRNNADGGPSGTLYKYLDNCVTSSGKRLLRRWICHPLKDADGINNRLNVVEYLMAHSEIMLLTAQFLRKLPDLERLLGQIRASAQSSASLSLPVFGKKVLKRRVKLFGTLVKGLRLGFDLVQLLEKEKHAFALLLKNFKLPVLSGSEGLDQFLTQFEAAINSDFPNYQNHDVTGQDAEIITILIELFVERGVEWSEITHAVNCIDVLRSFALAASSSTGVVSRPTIVQAAKNVSYASEGTNSAVLKIKGLWHPFAFGEDGQVAVPNDVVLGEDVSDSRHPHTMLLTGPNMGGKSTLLRSTCLAVILAQLGCYVPCEMCTFSLVDVIFTRLGASDRILTGESTFFIECTETASVLQNATQDSLVILDELGRGTSTFDGYAIAYAVFRHLIEKVNCRLLFATHYHPLTKEFGSHPRVTLQHMACSFKPSPGRLFQKDELVFLYRLAQGACPKSYGLQVATMAGIPDRVVEAASVAGEAMERSIGDSFKGSEGRSEFSTLHEGWLKNLMAVPRFGDNNVDADDVFDTLLCLWLEIKGSYTPGVLRMRKKSV